MRMRVYFDLLVAGAIIIIRLLLGLLHSDGQINSIVG